MKLIQVRQAKHTSSPRHVSPRERFSFRNWRVEVDCGTFVRVFTYSEFDWAMKNAQRLADWQDISIFGLRGFHIERKPTFTR